jgi:ABC-2 type transport system permease protein
MGGTLALARIEIVRLRRNKRYMMFTLALPVVLYLLVAKQVQHVTAYGVAYKAYYMVAMASFGAFSGALTGNAQRISQERKDGWIRQLRLTPLPPQSYVVAKIIASLAVSVPSILIVFLLGRFYGGVELAGWKWVVIGLAVWFGTLVFTALAVAIGYRFMPDTVQPMTMFVYLVMTFLGGVWFALGGVLQDIGQVLPTYQIIKIGTDVIGKGTVSVGSVAVILAWLAGVVILATLAVRATAETV